jgi:hypothetical protein
MSSSINVYLIVTYGPAYGSDMQRVAHLHVKTDKQNQKYSDCSCFSLSSQI